jgi:hypothetical protein
MVYATKFSLGPTPLRCERRLWPDRAANVAGNVGTSDDCCRGRTSGVAHTSSDTGLVAARHVAAAGADAGPVTAGSVVRATADAGLRAGRGIAVTAADAGTTAAGGVIHSAANACLFATGSVKAAAAAASLEPAGSVGCAASEASFPVADRVQFPCNDATKGGLSEPIIFPDNQVVGTHAVGTSEISRRFVIPNNQIAKACWIVVVTWKAGTADNINIGALNVICGPTTPFSEFA